MHRTFKALLVSAATILMLVNGCDTTESTQPDNTPKPSFTATIDGKTWAAGGPLSDDEEMYSLLQILGSKLVFYATKNVDDTSQALGMRITSPKAGINLLRPELDQSGHTGYFVSGVQDTLYYMTLADSGEVVIDHWDESIERISGTFWFTSSSGGGQRISGEFKDLHVRR